MRPIDILWAFSLLTRWPMPIRANADPARTRFAVWAYPVVGLAVGGSACLIGMGALAIGLSPVIAAGLVLSVAAISTGALHEDGLADCADGFWGGRERARRLEIMHDSWVGSYGVLALILVTGLRWVALATPGVILIYPAIAALSRAMMGVLFSIMPPARPDGLSASVGSPPPALAVLGLVLAVGCAVAMIGPVALVPCLAAGLGTFCVALIARAKIGGQTGDVLGASQQIAEVCALVACASTFVA